MGPMVNELAHHKGNDIKVSHIYPCLECTLLRGLLHIDLLDVSRTCDSLLHPDWFHYYSQLNLC